MSSQKIAIKTIYFSMASNTLLAALKWAAGFFGNSYALIADAIESTTDIFSSLLVLIGLKIANKPADKNHPYGHGRIEPLVTFLVVGFLIISAVIIANQSIKNIQTPHELPELYTLFILGAIIAWKEISYQVVIRKSKETGSSSLKADAWHHRSDAITSIAALLGISAALILGVGYEEMDDWAALLASFFILYNSYRIFRPAFSEIMDEDTHVELADFIRTISLKTKGVLGITACHIRKTGIKFYVDLHIMVDSNISVNDGHSISHFVKDNLLKELPELSDVLIHVEPDLGNSEAKDLK